MRVVSVSCVSFKGRIIDSHTHLGKWENVNYPPESLDIFTSSVLPNGDTVEKVITSNSSCLGKEGVVDELTGNRQMLEYTSHNPKIVPLAVCQPNLTNGDASKIEQLLKENPNKFAGLKFHPKCMELPADNAAYDNYLKLAEKYKLPCLFHTDKTVTIYYAGGGESQRCEYSRPEQVYALAKRHKNVPVILGHMGGNDGLNTEAAVNIMIDSIENDTAKLYADISWVNPDTSEKPDIIEAITRLKNTKKGDMTERLLFGTDAPVGRFGNGGENGLTPMQAYSKVVIDIKNSIKKAFSKEEADELIDKIFYRNAEALFFSQNSDIAASTKSVNQKCGKKYAIIAGIAAVIAVATGSLIKNFKSKNNS